MTQNSPSSGPARSPAAQVAAWIAFAVAFGLNAYGLFAPSAPGPEGIPGLDKVAHAGSFALLMLTGLMTPIPRLWLTVGLSGYAVASELVQMVLLPGRSGDVLDLLADGVGLVLGWVAWRAGRALRPSAARAGNAPGRSGPNRS